MQPTARGCSTVLTLILLTLGAETTAAFRGVRPESRFDDKTLPRTGGVIATAPRHLGTLEPGDGLRVGWEEFRLQHGGRWEIYLDERSGLPTMISGEGIRWLADPLTLADRLPGATLEQVEALARAFLKQNETRLAGDWSSLLALDLEASGERPGGAWQLVFRQSVDGVRVENARLDFHVVRGKLVMFGASNWTRPRVSGLPTLSADEARAVLDAHVGEPTAALEEARPPELTILALDAASSSRPRAWAGARGMGLRHALIWRFAFSAPGEVAMWIGEVDAHHGELVAFFDGAQYGAVRGGVFPLASTGNCRDDGCEIDGFPMPYADYTESGQATQFTDEFGNMSCVDPGATYQTTLNGQFVRIADLCGPISETVSCQAPLQLGLKTGENCDVPQESSPGNTAAARSSFYQINRAIEWAQYYLPGNTWLTSQVVVNTNVNDTCNASWNGELNMFREGDGCGNMGENQGLLLHEWGHGLDENDGGGLDNTSEAYGDVAAILGARRSCVGENFYNDGTTCDGEGDPCLVCTGLREMDFAQRVANTPATPQGFVQTFCGPGSGPCGHQVHCESHPISEAIYDLAARDLPGAGLDADSAWQLAERLWYETRAGSGGNIYTCALPDSDSCAAGTWYQRMRVADDDDGNLANGTPHAAALFAAFDRHNIACGGSSDPENQNTSSCVSPATPTLTVNQTGGGTQLDWNPIAGADDYLVFRGEVGCDRQQVVIGTVPSGTTSFFDATADLGLPRFYRVQARDANPTCRSAVSNCIGTPFAPRLQKHAHRIDDSGPLGNGDGVLDPGETARIPIDLFNGGLDDAFGVDGTLQGVGLDGIRVLDTVANWNDIPLGTERESLAPHFEVTVQPTEVCGQAPLDLELEMRAIGADAQRRRFGIPFGITQTDFANDDAMTVPPLTQTPVTSTLVFSDDELLNELDVSIQIETDDLSALIVEVTSPQGTTVRLHDQTSFFGPAIIRYDEDRVPDGPGTMDDFVGEPLQGTWTLSIQDVEPGVGFDTTLIQWIMHVDADGVLGCSPTGCAEPAPGSSVTGLMVGRDTGNDLVFDWGALGGVSGYHVLQSGVAPFDRGVNLSGRTDSSTTTLTFTDGVTLTPDLTFFQVRGVNACNWEGP